MKLQKQLRKARGFDVWIEVGRTNLKVHRVLNQLLGSLDLSLAQHEILVTIRRNSGLTQRQLSDRLLVVKSNVTALLKKLEGRDLVRRSVDPADSRNNLLSLTQSGHALVEESFALQNQVVRAMAGVMSDDELVLIGDVMRRVGDAVDGLVEDCAGTA